MAKRFTDTDKWKKPFIKSLKAPYKLLWLYILDECNHAGIWQVELDIASLRLGETIEEAEALNQFGNHVVQIGKGKWFIKDFIEFQYGVLNPENRAHKSVLDILYKYKIKPLTSPLQGCKDMDMDMVKDKDKDKVYDFESLWVKYPNNDGKKQAKIHFNASVKTDKDWKDINKALKNYLVSDKVLKGFVKNGSTWFNNWQDWIDPKMPAVCPVCKGTGEFISVKGYKCVCDCKKDGSVKPTSPCPQGRLIV